MSCCEQPNIIESFGFYVCNNCGECNGKIIIDAPIFIRRKGMSSSQAVVRQKEIVVHKFGNRTIINPKEARENNMIRLYKINKQDYKETHGWSMKYAIPIFNTLCHRMDTTDHVNMFAWKIYRNQVMVSKKTPIESSLGACLLLSSKFHNIPIDLDKLIDILDISKDKLFMQLIKISKYISE